MAHSFTDNLFCIDGNGALIQASFSYSDLIITATFNEGPMNTETSIRLKRDEVAELILFLTREFLKR